MQDLISEKCFLSIIIPTYNEAETILKLIDAIRYHLPTDISAEIIIVDDNSPDGTGTLVESYTQSITNEMLGSTQTSNDKNIYKKCLVKVIHRQRRNRLINAILHGVKFSTGQNILIMKGDFSHPPELHSYCLAIY